MVQKFFRIFTIFFQSGPPGRFLQILNSNPLISFNDVRQRRNTLSSDFASDSALNIMKLPDFSGNNKVMAKPVCPAVPYGLHGAHTFQNPGAYQNYIHGLPR